MKRSRSALTVLAQQMIDTKKIDRIVERVRPCTMVPDEAVAKNIELTIEAVNSLRRPKGRHRGMRDLEGRIFSWP